MNTPHVSSALVPAVPHASLAHIPPDYNAWDLPRDDEVLCEAPAPTLAQWLALHDFPGAQARGENGETPLMRAAREGDDAMLTALLDWGVDPNTVDDDGNHALWFACLHGNPACIRRLIEAGAPVDHANDDDVTCLMQAAASGRIDVLGMLLAHGADTDLYAPDGSNALDLATDLASQLLRLTRRVNWPSDRD